MNEFRGIGRLTFSIPISKVSTVLLHFNITFFAIFRNSFSVFPFWIEKVFEQQNSGSREDLLRMMHSSNFWWNFQVRMKLETVWIWMKLSFCTFLFSYIKKNTENEQTSVILSIVAWSECFCSKPDLNNSAKCFGFIRTPSFSGRTPFVIYRIVSFTISWSFFEHKDNLHLIG